MYKDFSWASGGITVILLLTKVLAISQKSNTRLFSKSLLSSSLITFKIFYALQEESWLSFIYLR